MSDLKLEFFSSERNEDGKWEFEYGNDIHIVRYQAIPSNHPYYHLQRSLEKSGGEILVKDDFFNAAISYNDMKEQTSLEAAQAWLDSQT